MTGQWGHPDQGGEDLPQAKAASLIPVTGEEGECSCPARHSQRCSDVPTMTAMTSYHCLTTANGFPAQQMLWADNRDPLYQN